MTNALKATLIHTLEVVLSIAVGYAIIKLFHVGEESYAIIVGIVVNSFIKWNRSASKGFLRDYVNES